tara:strand:- start:6297 stop:8246 length:1950 start_codon:yes stop_codon:yes gene_type:complete
LNDINISSQDKNEDTVDFSSFFNIFLRRKSLFIFSSILLFVFFILQTFYERKFNPVFRGEFKILINDPIKESSSSSPFSAATTKSPSILDTSQNYNLSSVIELLLSDQTLSPVASAFQISNEYLRDSITITKGGFNPFSAAALTITIDDQQIDRGQGKLNLLAERFEEVSLEEKQQKIIAKLNYLDKLLPKLQLNVFQIQNELVDFREKNNFITPLKESEGLKEKLFDIEQKIAIAKNKYQPNSSIMKNLIQERNTFLEIFQRQPELIKKYDNYSKRLQMAENVYENYIGTKQKLELDLASENVPFKIISTPYMDPLLVYPLITKNLINGFFISIFLGLFIIYVRDRFDNVYHSKKEIKREIKEPILAEIPFSKRFKDIRSSKDSKSNQAFIKSFDNKLKDDEKYNDFLFRESIRNLYLSYSLSNVAEEFKVISITSSITGEGKSFLNAMLAESGSKLGRKVLIIDADLRKPKMQNLFDLENIIGLTSLLTDKKLNWKDALQKVKNQNNISVLTAGPKPPDSIRLLSSAEMTNLIKSIKDSNMFDLIILDLPPVLGIADASYAFKNIDCVALICSLEKVPRELPKESIRILKSNPYSSFVGLIINEVNDKVISIKQNHDQYYSYYAEQENDEDKIEKDGSFIKKFLKKL